VSEPDPTFVPDARPVPVADTRKCVFVYLVDLRCLASGRDVGVLEARSWPCAGPVLFRARAAQPVVAVPEWRRLRCEVCRGNVYADEIHSLRVYPALSRDDLDVPRRGRPPKWLIAQRRAAFDGVPE
jgi:hypothetical protein